VSKLSQSFVKSVSDPGSYQDGRGLMLNVNPKGRKYWVLRYQIHGTRRDMGLGVFPTVSLKDARTEADRNRLLLSQGIDPLSKRDQQRFEAKRSRKDTFRFEAGNYIKAHSSSWSPRHTQQWRKSLETYVFPRMGKSPVSEITTDHVLEVLQPIWSSKPVTAARLRNRIELILDASRAKGLREGDNPARWRGHLDKLLPKQRQQSSAMPAMPYQDIPGFMRELDAVDSVAARGLEAIILSGLRTEEVLNARWGEIDLEARVWTVPAERMKNGRAHRVPICDALLGVFEQTKGLDPSLVFPSQKHANKPVAANAAWRLMRAMGVVGYVPHGFRASFRTWAGEETNHPREVCELCLAHTLAGRTEAAYSRGDKLEKRRALMAEWAAFVREKLAQAA